MYSYSSFAELYAEQKPSIKRALDGFNQALLCDFYNWTYSQFNLGVYTPSTSQIMLFMARTLNDFVRYYQLPHDIEWAVLHNDWCLDEPFMDYFGD
ncbi:hypothetical protein [Thalassotalea marina]|uniref:Uncharacterized protein n=1 Tax=Thalassotalea marina TaxID=1673741 RepID=A0A919BQ94_9GAMM|nr:hypothetical protein [Thalassotalea marina]GHG07214.1 hypothetical protein GCM10017161_41180 [Thalassotalea marina]